MRSMEEIYEKLCRKIVGRKVETGIILAAIQAGKPILLLGMPGVSKTTILQAISHELHGDRDFLQATGDEQLSAYSLVGGFDPAFVIKEGYKKEYFLPGPLTKAMRLGGILYIEELNRAPSGALNVLMTALSDGYIEIPHYGRVHAEPGFSLIGSCNPADDIGTERLSRGLADRFVMLDLDYQSEDEEMEILSHEHTGWSSDWISFAVRIARESRVHPDLRCGSSIRGSIDFLSLLNSWTQPPWEIVEASGVAAFLSKIQVKPSSGRKGTEIIREIMQKILPPSGYGKLIDHWQKSSVAPEQGTSGGSLVEAGGASATVESKGGALKENSGPSPPSVDPEWGGTGAGGIRGVSGRKPDQRPFMDVQLRMNQDVDYMKQYRSKPWVSLQEVERWGEQTMMTVRGGQSVLYGRGGMRLSSRPWPAAAGAEIDLDGTLNRMMNSFRDVKAEDILIRYRVPVKKDFIVFVDHSGSMAGRKLAISAVLAGALARLGARQQCGYGVYAFDQELSIIKQLNQHRDMNTVLSEIMHLPEGRSTDLSKVFQFALQLLNEHPSAEFILVSDCMPTRGEKMFQSLNRIIQRIPVLHICYVGSSGGDFRVNTFNGEASLDLYGWWGSKWVGPDHFYTVHDLSDVPQAVDAMVNHNQTGNRV